MKRVASGDAMTIRRGPRKGQLGVKLRPETRKRLEALGRERALVYKSFLLTGLRLHELRTLTIGQLELDAEHPHVVLDAPDEKNRSGSGIALRADLVADMRQWLAGKLEALRQDCRDAGEPLPVCLPADTPVFYVPKSLVKILHRDLAAAEIRLKDDRGRWLDVHALRHTFGAHLSKGEVPLRTAQAAMRHSDPKLTARRVHGPRLLDVAGALAVLPALPLDGEHDSEAITGTDAADQLVPDADNQGKSLSSADKTADKKAGDPKSLEPHETHSTVQNRQALPSADRACDGWALQDLNLWPPACKAGALAN